MNNSQLTLVVIAVIGLFIGCLVGCPAYNVYSARMSGKAQMAKAEQNRQIIVEQAKAEEQAAKHQAKAIEIMGEVAKQYPEYRQQEFIGAFGQALKDGSISQIIYVPTEANIPIMEAGRNGLSNPDK